MPGECRLEGDGKVGLYAGESARRSIDLATARSILEAEIKERNEAALAYSDPDMISKMRREAELIDAYLTFL